MYSGRHHLHTKTHPPSEYCKLAHTKKARSTRKTITADLLIHPSVAVDICNKLIEFASINFILSYLRTTICCYATQPYTNMFPDENIYCVGRCSHRWLFTGFSRPHTHTSNTPDSQLPFCLIVDYMNTPNKAAAELENYSKKMTLVVFSSSSNIKRCHDFTVAMENQCVRIVCYIRKYVVEVPLYRHSRYRFADLLAFIVHLSSIIP